MSIRKVETKLGPRWELRYHLNGRDSKRVKRSFQTKREAELCWEQWCAQKRDRNPYDLRVGTFEETTFAEEADNWLAVHQKIFSPSHYKRAAGIIQEFKQRYGKFAPNRFHSGFLTGLQAEQLAQGLKPSTVNRKLEVVRAILKFSAAQRRIPYDPVVGYRKLKVIQKDIIFWDQQEAASFLAFADKKYPRGSQLRWVYVAYLLCLNTGLRAGEVWGLRLEDVDRNGELIKVERQFDRVNKSFGPTKGRTDRRVPCNDELLMELRALAARNVSTMEQFSMSAKQEGQFVTTTLRNESLIGTLMSGEEKKSVFTT